MRSTARKAGWANSTLGVPGLHNARNAALAVVTALQIGVPFEPAAAALARFVGVTRRFEFRGEANGVTFVDDYAHLPFAVRAALATARGGGWSRVVAVFQPHRYSRTAELADQFGTAFEDADALVVTDVYGAGEVPVPGISGRLIADAVRVAGSEAPGDLRTELGRSSPGRLVHAPARGSVPHPGCGGPDGSARRVARVATVVMSATRRARVEALADALGPRALRNHPLGPLTTYGVGGPAALLVEVEGPDDLAALRPALAGSELPVCVLGRGSNLLVADAGFDGVVVRLGNGFNWVTLPSPDPAGPPPFVLRTGAATPLPVVARQAADAGWAGLTWAVGVPGSVGGAVRMNAGGHGSDMAGCLLRYSWVDLEGGEGGTDDAARLCFGYRSSSIGPGEAVVEAELEVTAGRSGGGTGRAGVHRPLAADPSTGWVQCRFGLHESARRPGGKTDRRGGPQGRTARHGPGLGEACQLHPGRPGRQGGRRAGPHGARAGAGARAQRRGSLGRGPPPGLR